MGPCSLEPSSHHHAVYFGSKFNNLAQSEQGCGVTAKAPPEISPEAALRRQHEGAVLVDVRETHEFAAGRAECSIGIPLGQVTDRIAEACADPHAELLLICATGRRSLLACDELLKLGYRNVHSVQGGFERWRREGFPLAGMALDADAAERYSRHLLLPEVGVEGQQRLFAARVALVGAGGLGAPIALYLAAAGVGHITLIDDDVVERSNLQRQVIHNEATIGARKVESAKAMLTALNPRLHVTTHATRIVASNVEGLLRGHELIIDGADNFPTRYLLDAASRRLRIPMIYGAVHRFTGQVSVFDPRRDDSPCYRCLFPRPPSAAEAPNCSEAGVLGVLPGTIGMLQATEALKLLLGRGNPLVGRLLCYDALAARFRELALPRDPDCPGCGPTALTIGYEDIENFCSKA